MAGKATERARAAERARSEHQRKVGADFRQRHPARAREEQAIKRFNKATRENHAHSVNATPETRHKASYTRQGSLARLYERGHISLDQLAASQSIRAVAERIGADVAIGTMSMETRVDTSRDFGAAFFEKLGSVRAEVAYTRWRAALAKPGPVLAMIVRDEACRGVARRHRMRDARARALLLDALDLWGEIVGQVCKEIDTADLAAAQAGIL